jgi:hypothetical protein
MVTTFKRLRNIAVGSALVLASAGAFAAPGQFIVDASDYSPITAPFTATGMNGSSSARIVNDAGTFNYTGTGYIQYTSFTMNNAAISATTTGLNFYYGLYATFTQNFSCNNLLGVGTTCNVTGISLNLYADVGNNSTFNQSTLGANATVTNTGGDVLLGSVTNVIAGTAGVNSLGGAFQNVNTNFVLSADGSDFFVNPTPFYSLAFSVFNNTSQGLQCSPNCTGGITTLAINSENGGTDFNAVPEPMPLALMGLGMLGMVAFRRKQAKK